MCAPNDDNNNASTPPETQRVVISGAGPAGLLLTALLMQRNAALSTPKYHVTLLDGRADFGSISQEDLKRNHRSWMLGLASHGCEALRECKGLYQEYCREVGILLKSLSLHLGSREFVQNQTTADSKEEFPENFIVDRNFIVAAMARFIKDRYGGEGGEAGELTLLYQHKLMYVDYEQQRVLVRSAVEEQKEFYLPYDLLVGCDGFKSVVREALVKRHSTFEVDVGDIFQTFKAVHVKRPNSVKESSMHVLPEIFPNFQGIALPETGDMLNISAGIPRHLFDDDAKMAPELKSDDPKVVAEYVRKNFKAFSLIDYDDFAQQWVNQRWNRTGQVHCNFYHSTDINVVIMGDAAHATSPSIGMGMNQALRDAQTFYQLVVQHKDDLNQVLPAFSEMRVKEGNSLSDLAMHLYCFDTKVQLLETLHLVVRSALHKILPKNWISEHPQTMIGRLEYELSDVYDHATNLGIMGKHRRVNAQIRQAYFEQQTGMVKSHKGSQWTRNVLFASGVALTAIFMVWIR